MSTSATTCCCRVLCIIFVEMNFSVDLMWQEALETIQKGSLSLQHVKTEVQVQLSTNSRTVMWLTCKMSLKETKSGRKGLLCACAVGPILSQSVHVYNTSTIPQQLP